MSNETQFWMMVDASAGSDGCWAWLGACNDWGYGTLHVNGIKIYAHRYSYELHNGPLNGDQVCHKCDNPPCCNPSHLFRGTQADNMRDMVTKGRHGSQIHPESRPRGEKHTQAKLTRATVIEIRQRYAKGGISQKRLAREYGVAQGTIWHMLAGETWKDV